ncbi:unnamed protein product [Linum trigynum]|uniref:Uncharacterized protein n=1 Tax=Linum trigynum TaxID=586398 RepID=A0AAV2DT94_9ROSI
MGSAGAAAGEASAEVEEVAPMSKWEVGCGESNGATSKLGEAEGPGAAEGESGWATSSSSWSGRTGTVSSS